MKDPFYADILFAIETKIHEGDRLAASQGVKLTDSNVRSLVIKASHASQGKRPQPAPQDFVNPKDKFLGKLFEELMAVKDSLAVEEKLPDGTTEHQELSAAEWVSSLGAIKESCSLRTGREPGSRDYLDFLAGFIAQARAGND